MLTKLLRVSLMLGNVLILRMSYRSELVSDGYTSITRGRNRTRNVTRYAKAFKDRAVARLLPPGSVSVDLVSQEPHISVATLERWRAAASEAPRKADKGWLWTFVPGAKEGNWAVAYHFGDNRTCEKARACWMIGGASWSAMTSAVTRRDSGREVGCTAGRCRPSVTPCRSWTVRNPRAGTGCSELQSGREAPRAMS